jgi:hypothetical protein
MEMNGKPIDYIHTRKVNNNKTNTKNNSKHQSQSEWWWMKENENFWKHEKYTMQKKDTGSK